MSGAKRNTITGGHVHLEERFFNIQEELNNEEHPRQKNDQERIRFNVTTEELIEIYRHCIDNSISISRLCREAVSEKMKSVDG